MVIWTILGLFPVVFQPIRTLFEGFWQLLQRQVAVDHVELMGGDPETKQRITGSFSQCWLCHILLSLDHSIGITKKPLINDKHYHTLSTIILSIHFFQHDESPTPTVVDLDDHCKLQRAEVWIQSNGPSDQRTQTHGGCSNHLLRPLWWAGYSSLWLTDIDSAC